MSEKAKAPEPVLAHLNRIGVKFKGEGEADVDSLSHDGRGVAHVDGKAVFIEGALPGEQVRYGITRIKPKFENALATEVLEFSPHRVFEPRCAAFGVCGGCALQHMDDAAQIHEKQKIVEETLSHVGDVAPKMWLDPLHGASWGYRRRARLGARLVPKKGGLLVGFREKNSSYLTDIKTCHVLDERAAKLIPVMRKLITNLSCPDRIPQIEIAAGDEALALVFRHLVAFTNEDRRDLIAFAKKYEVIVYSQPGGPDSITPIWPEHPDSLSYSLTDFDVSIEFRPTDFTQVNADLNRLMVARAVDLLELSDSDRVLDLFCGLGNFTLPLARRAGEVYAIEGDAILVEGARANAKRNKIKNVRYAVGDLYKETESAPWGEYRFNKLLLDPPRSGAMEVIQLLPKEGGPERIVYVSCYPATLARDARYLVHVLGYKMVSACVMDMFPQTAHVEAMALFVKDGA